MIDTSQADWKIGADLYAAIAAGGDEERLICLTVPGEPKSKARARFGKGHAYRDSGDSAAEKYVGWHLAQTIKEPFTGNVAVGCVFFRPNRQRIDTDNMLKLVCDAANGIVWADDSQVTAVIGLTELDPENPRTVIVFGNHRSTLARGSDDTYPCSICGGSLSPVNGQRPKTCSKECASQARGYDLLAALVPCATCGEPFRRKTKMQKYCGKACSDADRRGRAKGKGRQFSRCSACDALLSHYRGGLCRTCWKASISLGTPLNGGGAA